jgi:competence protein ComEA
MTSSFPFTRRHALAGAAVVLVLLALGGRLLQRSPASAEALPVEPVVAQTAEAEPPEPPEQAQLVVHVVGAVRRPGLYRVDEGSRVADAVSLAGGATGKANLAALNLAAPLIDGTQVIVPRKGQDVPPAGAASPGASPGGAAAGPIRLNTATAEELQTIPGVGPVTAQRIIDYRDQNGGFRSVEELDAVSGIGPKRLEQLRDLVTP